MEKLLPECLRRNWVIRTETLEPNKRSNKLWSLLKDESTMQNIAQRVISEFSGDAIGHLQARQVSNSRETIHILFTYLWFTQDDLLGKVSSMKSTVREMQREMERTNTILTAIAIKTGLRDLEEEEIWKIVMLCQHCLLMYFPYQNEYLRLISLYWLQLYCYI